MIPSADHPRLRQPSDPSRTVAAASVRVGILTAGSALALLLLATTGATVRAAESALPATPATTALPDPTGWQLAVIDDGRPSVEARAHFEESIAYLRALPEDEGRLLRENPDRRPAPEIAAELERATDEFLAAARHARPDWPPPVQRPADWDNPEPNTVFMSSWEMTLPYSVIRNPHTLLLTEHARRLAAEGQPERAARLLLALFDHGRQVVGHEYHLLYYFSGYSAQIQSINTLSELAPDFPPEVREKVAMEIDRRLATVTNEPFLKAMDFDFEISRHALRRLRTAPNRERLAINTHRAIREVMEMFEPRPAHLARKTPPTPTEHQFREWADRLGVFQTYRVDLIRELEKIVAAQDELLSALREGRDPDPARRKVEELVDADDAFLAPLLLRSAGGNFPLIHLHGILSLPLLRAGYACLAEPDPDRWSALPEMRHPLTGQPFAGAAQTVQAAFVFQLHFRDGIGGAGAVAQLVELRANGVPEFPEHDFLLLGLTVSRLMDGAYTIRFGASPGNRRRQRGS